MSWQPQVSGGSSLYDEMALLRMSLLVARPAARIDQEQFINQ